MTIDVLHKIVKIGEEGMIMSSEQEDPELVAVTMLACINAICALCSGAILQDRKEPTTNTDTDKQV